VNLLAHLIIKNISFTLIDDTSDTATEKNIFIAFINTHLLTLFNENVDLSIQDIGIEDRIVVISIKISCQFNWKQ